MDQGNNGNFDLIFDGTGKPGIIGYLHANLKTRSAYRFKVSAVNFNGEGPDSAEAMFYSCLPPLDLTAPKYLTSDQTTLTIHWKLPLNINGCPIYEYKVYRDDGSNGDLTTLVGTYEPHIS